ncbi:MAG: glycosyltransferase family 4 protein [Prevotella sp.]|nr:glycosyltransferase family 4 protein [Prevotella sp.]
MNHKSIIITAPSLDPTQNVSGVSTVVQFIIDNNKEREYRHFQIGKTDRESGGVLHRLWRIWRCYGEWRLTLTGTGTITKIATKAIIHYSFPLSAPSILRDPWFMHYALKKGCKMVVHVHGGLFLTAPKIPFLLERILKWVFSWDVPFIVLSEGEKETLEKRFGAKRVEVLPNCPDAPKGNDTQSEIATKCSMDYENGCNNKDNRDNKDNITPLNPLNSMNLELFNFEPASVTSDLNLEPTCEASALNQRRALILGYLGRIEPNKGMTELLDALKRLKAEGVRFKVKFAGKEQTEGEYLPKFKEILGENFEYCGLVSGESKREFLSSLDVFVMPTYFEGLPMSLLETMGYGVVPVVTQVGSIPTVVKGGENGLFVKVKDVQSIVEAIRRLEQDRNLLARLSEKAENTIKENFSATRYVERLNAIYDSL